MLQQGPQGRLNMESMRNTSDFEDFSVVDVVIKCMYQCMKLAEFKALGTKIIKIS